MDRTTIEEHLGWHPAKSLSGKRNFKNTFRVAEDGTVTQLIRLRVHDKFHREQIICRHFLSSWVRWVVRERVAITFTSRDKPWDFGIELSTGHNFSLEITSIAEGQQQFVERSREQRLGGAVDRPTIPLSLLRKIDRDCTTEESSMIIAAAEGLHRDAEVPNPWYEQAEPIWLSTIPANKASFFQLIANAIAAKAEKPHSGKEATILVIDNRNTQYDLDAFHEASYRFDELRKSSPFLEVYLYTGFYSDDDGSNAEWSLAPVLVTDESLERTRLTLAEMNMEPNKAGIIFGGF